MNDFKIQDAENLDTKFEMNKDEADITDHQPDNSGSTQFQDQSGDDHDGSECGTDDSQMDSVPHASRTRKCSGKKGPSYDLLHILDIDEKESIRMTAEELFDPSKYSDVKLVSYVASPKFFCERYGQFTTVQAILGMDDPETLQNISRGIIQNWEFQGIGFFQGCDDSVKGQISDGSFQLRFMKPGFVAHSKIYLLKGEGGYLTAVGSSNATSNGFGDGIKQYEEIMISHDKEIYDIYLSRFETIYADTVDCVPEGCKKLWLTEHRNADENEAGDIKIAWLDGNREDVMPTTAQVKYLKAMAKGNTEGSVRAERVVKLITSVTGKADAKRRKPIKPLADLQEAKQKFVQVTSTKVVGAGDDPVSESDQFTRMEFIYQPEEQRLFAMRPGIDHSVSLWSERLSTEGLRRELERIDSLAQFYVDNTVNGNADQASKIYEIIMRGMFSPFMSKLRQDYKEYYNASDNIIADIPNILLINGEASTGKTAILNVLNGMLSDRAFGIPAWSAYKKDKDNKRELDNEVRENNIYPIIIDEIESDFISGGIATYKGEKWIKNISNTVLPHGEHPYIIGSTNHKLMMKSAIRKRVDYITLDAKLQLSSETRAWLSLFTDSCTTKLFKDFCARMEEKIHSGLLYSKDFDDKYSCDFIGMARQIFKECYAECGMDVPSTFPEQRMDDFSYRGKNMWKDAYLDPNLKQAFRLDGNDLVISWDHLNHSSSKYSKTPELLMSFLNETLKKGNNITESPYTHIDAEKFFDWIGVQVPSNEETPAQGTIPEASQEKAPKTLQATVMGSVQAHTQAQAQQPSPTTFALSPCPMCGNQGERIRVRKIKTLITPKYKVHCGYCGTAQKHSFLTMEKASEAWNHNEKKLFTWKTA